MAGWIVLDRKIFDNFLYSERPFCRLAAFVDLILLANHEDRDILFDGEVISVLRGSFITSFRKLCDRWGWSRTKVSKFLRVLERERMITTNSDKKKTLITLMNYGKYQLAKDTEKTVKRHRNDTDVTLKNTNNNENNDNNENNKKMTIVEGRIYLKCVSSEIKSVDLYKPYIFKFIESLTEEEIYQAIEQSVGQHAKYLLAALESKTKKTSERKSASPVRNRKPKLKIHKNEDGTLSAADLEELKKLASALDGKDKS